MLCYFLLHHKVNQLCVYIYSLPFEPPSLVAQLVKNPAAMAETWVWSLGGEYPLEKEMATHSSILAWKISWPEEPGGLQSMGSQTAGHDWSDWHLLTFLLTHPCVLHLQVIMEHQATLPVLRCSFPPAIYFTHGNIRMSMLLSQCSLHFYIN